MQVAVTFRRVKPSEGLRQYAIEKTERLQRFLRKPIEAHVILAVVKQRQTAEVVITGKSLGLSATAETKDLYSAIDLVTDKIARQLERSASKAKRHRDATAPATTKAAEPVEAPAPKLKRQRMTLRSLSLEQATSRLRGSKSDFVLFENKSSGALNLLYRRKDGELGVIEVEAAS